MGDHDVRATVAVKVADLHQGEVSRLFLEVEGHVRLGGKGAVGPAAVDGHSLAPAELDEVGLAVAVEVAVEQGELAHPQIVQIDFEGARKVQALDRTEGAVLLLAPDVEIE